MTGGKRCRSSGLFFRRVQSARLERGATLLEVLVAMVVMALGLLGIMGVQMRTLADTGTCLPERYLLNCCRLIVIFRQISEIEPRWSQRWRRLAAKVSAPAGAAISRVPSLHESAYFYVSLRQ